MKKHTFLFIAFASITAFANAQNPNLLYIKGAEITIQPGAFITVLGEVVNTDNTAANIGKIHNQGDIYISENWRNNSTGSALDPNDGTVTFTPTVTIPFHTIDGTTETTFNNFVLAGLPMVLNVNTTVSGTIGHLDLGSLFLMLNSKTLTVTNSSPNGSPTQAIVYVAGGSIISETDFATGYGKVKWNITSSTLGTQFIVPFSTTLLNGLTPVPVTFQPAANITDINGRVTFSTYPTTTAPAVNNRPLPSGVLNSNSPCGMEWASRTSDRFYVINATGYSAIPASQLTLGYLDSEWDATSGSSNLIIENKLKIMRYDTKWNVLGGTANTASNDVTQGNITKYGNFSLTNFDPIKTTYKDSTMVSCFGGNNGEIQVTVTSGNKPYSFNFLPMPGVQIDSTANGLKAGTYHVIVTDAAGCDSTLRNIVITQPTKLRIDSINGTNPTCPLNADGLVTFKGSGGTPNVNSPLYTFAPTPSAGVTVSPNGAFATLTGLPSGKTIVEITDANGCKADTSVLLVAPLPFKATLGNDVAVCEGNEGQIWVDIDPFPLNGKGPYTYTWVEVPGPSLVAQHPSNLETDTLNITPLTTQQYGVNITDACNTNIQLSPITITVNPIPVPDFTSPLAYGCERLNVEFNSTTTTVAAPSTITSWLWNFGDGSSSVEQNPSHLYTDKGAYDVTLTATTSEGCSSTLPYGSFVNINPNPVAAFTFDPKETNITEPNVTFDNNSSSDVIAVQWNFGETSEKITSLAPSILNTYTDTGVYIVSLKVVNQFACRDSVTQIVKVKPSFTFFIPNSFTPNTDNINEVFFPRGSYYKNYIIRIYDRWGEKIFLSGTSNEGWDGKLNNGLDAPVGVYVYKIQVEETAGKDHYYSGTVSLIR
ncbi:MAG: gliding motility-associated C-terminal domain-containing protein [Bacteroidia bacterium]|nr:gliding motility-associated C-terminal domain-containing protein [Bacteroidia bacterium]